MGSPQGILLVDQLFRNTSGISLGRTCTRIASYLGESATVFNGAVSRNRTLFAPQRRYTGACKAKWSSKI